MDLRLEKCGCKKSARELEMGAFKLLSPSEKVRPKKHTFICSVFVSIDKSMTYAICVTNLTTRLAHCDVYRLRKARIDSRANHFDAMPGKATFPRAKHFDGGAGGAPAARSAPSRYKCIHIQPTGGMI